MKAYLVSNKRRRIVSILVPTFGLAVLLGAVCPAGAGVVYQNGFEDVTDRNKGFSGSADATGPGGSFALHVSDSTTGSGPSGSLTLNNSNIAAFDTTQPGQSTLRIDADYSITSLFNNTTNSNSIPRIRLQSPAGVGSDLFVGFGQNANSEVVLFAARGNNPGPGSSGATTLFNYGAYDTTTAANNDTNGYVHLALSYVDQSTTFTVEATQGGITNTAVLTGFTPTSFDSTLTKTFASLTGTTSTSETYLDNVTIQAVPEPTAVATMLGGFGLLAIRRTRARMVFCA